MAAERDSPLDSVRPRYFAAVLSADPDLRDNPAVRASEAEGVRVLMEAARGRPTLMT